MLRIVDELAGRRRPRICAQVPSSGRRHGLPCGTATGAPAGAECFAGPDRIRGPELAPEIGHPRPLGAPA
ncbi:hypothetical protein HRW23_10530 [Streptomyces lunaelactis]|uniref:hypothetical protein n=1 Tax=Streptomyces lunaelactis TaxID=1535768 RepID=UPI001584E39E|nr:hypothetical protein [Streptomyces lunaelactis]NUK55355.1 hypothetical protein [Streptomyces lunaelactis]NUK69036.1 hypothetical protein [Streptomyces lunaelactis]NUK77827.1 hypothetical protein [Streptomyces lunaelactis]